MIKKVSDETLADCPIQLRGQELTLSRHRRRQKGEKPEVGNRRQRIRDFCHWSSFNPKTLKKPPESNISRSTQSIKKWSGFSSSNDFLLFGIEYRHE